jgi:hypothetical protein
MANHRRTSEPRLASLRAALKAAKPTDDLTLDALTVIWGSSKGQFTKIRDACLNFPAHKTGPHGVLIYPARPALQALIALETKDDKAAETLAKRQNAMLGSARRAAGRNAKPAQVVVPIEQLTKAFRLSAEIEQRERDQGEYVRSDDVARVLGNAFSIISGKLSTLETLVDPDGTMPLPLREMISQAGKDVLLQAHAAVKHMLAGDVRRNPPRARKAQRSARQP